MATVYDIGDLVRVSGAFVNTAEVATDPTALKLAIRTPSGVETVLVSGVDAAIVHDGTGAYHYDLPITESGSWHYRWIATGAVTAAEEGTIKVRASQFTTPLP